MYAIGTKSAFFPFLVLVAHFESLQATFEAFIGVRDDKATEQVKLFGDQLHVFLILRFPLSSIGSLLFLPPPLLSSYHKFLLTSS